MRRQITFEGVWAVKNKKGDTEAEIVTKMWSKFSRLAGVGGGSELSTA